MNTTRITKVSNPHMTDNQKRYFGTKRQRAALKASRKRKRNAGVRHKHKARAKHRAAPRKHKRKPNAHVGKKVYKARKKKHTRKRTHARKRKAANPARKTYKARKKSVHRARPRKAKARRKTHKRRNPPLMLVAGPVNPKRRVKTVARKKKYHRKHSRRNPVHVKGRHKRRNPSIFGQRQPIEIAKMATAVVAGVSAAKLIPAMIPIPASANNLLVKVAVTGGVAFLTGWAAREAFGPVIGDAVALGGLAQTASMALNGLLPAAYSQYASLGDFVRGGFPVPMNPVGMRLLPGGGRPMASGGAAQTPGGAAVASGGNLGLAAFGTP
jgi:hypothetical protein